MFFRFRFLQLSLCIPLLLFVGCGDGSMGRVEGVVKFDGQPVDRALVTFYPADARASVGFTDDDGRYYLNYTGKVKGAVVGEHQVTISTRIDKEDDNVASKYGGKGREEFLPPKYHSRRETELTATVESGNNTIDFDLEPVPDLESE